MVCLGLFRGRRSGFEPDDHAAWSNEAPVDPGGIDDDRLEGRAATLDGYALGAGRVSGWIRSRRAACHYEGSDRCEDDEQRGSSSRSHCFSPLTSPSVPTDGL